MLNEWLGRQYAIGGVKGHESSRVVPLPAGSDLIFLAIRTVSCLQHLGLDTDSFASGNGTLADL